MSGLALGLRAQRHGGDPEHGQQRHWANRHGRPAADRQPARPDRRGCERHGGFETHGQRAGRDRLAGNVARKLPCGRCDQRAVTFGYSYPGGGSGSLNDTESASVAAYSGGADANGVTLAGSPNSITSSAAFTRNFTGTATVGSGSGNFTLNVTPELSSSATVTAAYTISVTSGSMNWSGPSGGSWSTGGWTDTVAGGAPVAPGLNPSWTHSDVAKFGSGAGSATTVNLDVSPSLAAVAFSGTTAYKLAAAGGTLTLNNAGNGASIAANASAPSVINAPLVLADNLTVSGSGTLEFGPTGTITDNGAGKALILNAAGGILELSGSNSYSGGTTVADGTLIAAENEAIQDGTNLYVGSGLSAFLAQRFPRKPIAPTRQPKSQRFPNPVRWRLLVAAGTLLLIRRKRLGGTSN